MPKSNIHLRTEMGEERGASAIAADASGRSPIFKSAAKASHGSSCVLLGPISMKVSCFSRFSVTVKG